jgi:F-type H+-transporting ATPase subunit b
MSGNSNSKGVPYIIKLIAGLAFMFGGFYLYVNKLGEIPAIKEMGLDLNLGKTLFMLGVLWIVFPAITTFYLKPLQDAIDERNNALESTFAEAEQLRTDMSKMKGDYERQLAETEAAARTQIQEEISKAQELRRNLEATAAAAAEEMKRKASAEIATERERVLTELRVKTVDLTLAATERLIGENMNDERNRKLIQEFIDKAEVPA